MKNAKKYLIVAGLVVPTLLLTACEENKTQSQAVVESTAPAESGQNETENRNASDAKPAFAILSAATGDIDILMKPVSAPADKSFKNTCKAGAQPFGLSDINFGGKLYCSDSAGRQIQVVDIETGAELFSWAWPADVSSSVQWLIGRWQGGSNVGLAAYDSSAGTFHMFNQTEKSFNLSHSFEYGGADKTLTPIAGDWNGDGIDSIGIYKPASLQMDLRNSLDPGIADISFRFVEGTLKSNSVAVTINTGANTSAGVYSVEDGSVTLGSIDLAAKPQEVFLFGAPGVSKTALPVR